MRIILLIILLAVVQVSTVLAQNQILKINHSPIEPYSASPIEIEGSAKLSGYILDSASSETVVGATVTVKGSKLGAYTNKSGFFSIINILPGEQTITISSLGFVKKEIKINFKPDESVRRKFKIIQSSVITGEVFVQAEKEVEQREITMSKINIPIKQLKEIRIGGESDVFRALQFLPGILTSSQLSSGLFVRGGSPDQNLVLVDGSVVYNPTHLFGFISAFNTDAIKDVELIKGGFPAEYGGRLSAVLNITQKDGNQEKISGIAALGLISSKASLEGPLFDGSWFISGRRTYFDLIQKLMPTDPANPIPNFNFYDLNAKITQNLSDNDKLFISGFMSQDALAFGNYGTTMDMKIANKLGAIRWTHIFGSNLFTNINFSASNYLNSFSVNQSGYKSLIDNSITDYTMKGSVEWFASDKLTNKFGFEISNLKFGFLENFTGNTDSTQSGSTSGLTNIAADDWNYSVFGQINYKMFELLSLQAGLRANYWQISRMTTLEPRLSLRYQIQENMAIKAGFGLYNQNLRLASIPDFSFFDTWLPTDSTVPVSKSVHYILSLETKPLEGYDVNFDIYFKQMFNVSELKVYPHELKVVRDVFYIGDARSYGAEVFIQKKYGDFTGWIGYALGYIYSKFDSINNGQEFRPKYDRRHDLKIVLLYKYSERWEFGASFTLQSGQSYTGATSRGQIEPPGTNYGRGITIPSERYGLRLPASHQLNINASFGFKTFKLPSRVILDIYNVYDRKDIWFRYYNTQGNETKVEDVRLLPIIPTISYEVKF